MKIILLILLLLFAIGDLNARPRHRQRPIHYRSEAYRLNNRIFIKWTPTTLAPTCGAAFRVGAEYCFSGKYGFALEAGPLMHYGGPIAGNIGSFTPTGGVGIWPEFRKYFGFRSSGRGFVGLQGMYRHEKMSAGEGPYFEYPYNGYSQTGGTLNAAGLALEIGFVARVGAALHVELATGAGFKSIHAERENFRPIPYGGGSSPRNYSPIPSEDEIISSGSVPYVFLAFKISLLTGRPITKQH